MADPITVPMDREKAVQVLQSVEYCIDVARGIQPMPAQDWISLQPTSAARWFNDHLRDVLDKGEQKERDMLPEQKMYKPFFDMVCSKENWKNPIDAMVDAPTSAIDRALFKQMISQAVVFHAGCVPVIVDLGGKQIGVKAVGYYKAVGA